VAPRRQPRLIHEGSTLHVASEHHHGSTAKAVPQCRTLTETPNPTPVLEAELAVIDSESKTEQGGKAATQMPSSNSTWMVTLMQRTWSGSQAGRRSGCRTLGRVTPALRRENRETDTKLNNVTGAKADLDIEVGADEDIGSGREQGDKDSQRHFSVTKHFRACDGDSNVLSQS
jgi:hypothetical protein